MLYYKKVYTKKIKFDGAKSLLNCKFHKCPKVAYYFSRVLSIASDFLWQKFATKVVNTEKYICF